MKESKCYAEKRFFKWQEDEIAVSLRAKSGSYGGGSEVLVLTYNQISQSAGYKEDETAVSLTVCGGSYGGGSETLIVQKVAGTVNAGAHPGSYNGQDAYNDMLVVSDENDLVHRGGETSQTLDASYFKGCGTRNGKEREVLATEPTYLSNRKGHNGVTEDGTATTLTAQEKERPLTATSVVRRLTPMECERLQGMPDDWSKYGVNEKGEVYELPDSARYRLQGNGIATPFWRYLLKRISAQYERTPTLGSLFDGQASFPMIWESINGPGTALWSSEIEKHAIAVAKYHFPEEAE